MATFSASRTQSTLAASFSTIDGWALAISGTRVFNVAHHQPTLQVACHNQADGSSCWPGPAAKTVTDGVHKFATSIGAGLYLNQSNGHLYVYVDETVGNTATDTAGVACIDTTLPANATGQQMFCGFTALSAAGDAPLLYDSDLTAPVLVGHFWYSFNEVLGAAAGGSGTKNTLLCFDVAAGTACAGGHSFPVALNGTISGGFGAAPPIGSAGSDVFVPVQATVAGVAKYELGCFNTATMSTCTGAWPNTIAGVAGSPFPMLTGTGSAKGICVPIAGDPCYSFVGQRIPTPANLTNAIQPNGVAKRARCGAWHPRLRRERNQRRHELRRNASISSPAHPARAFRRHCAISRLCTRSIPTRTGRRASG